MIGPPPVEMDEGDMDEDEQRGRQATRSRLADGCPGISRFRSRDRTPLPFAFAALFVAVPQTGWAQTARQVTPPTYAPPSVRPARSEEHTSELQSLMRCSYAVLCMKNKLIYCTNITLALEQRC